MRFRVHESSICRHLFNKCVQALPAACARIAPAAKSKLNVWSMQASAPARRLLVSKGGNVAVLGAVGITGLAIVSGVAVDYGTMVSKRSSLQAMADAASIAATRELMLANTSGSELEAVAKNMVSLDDAAAGQSIDVSVTVDRPASSVEVQLTEEWAPYFAHLVSDTVKTITAQSVAKLVGSEKVCVLSLEETAPSAVSMTNKAQIKAANCGVYSNSASATGLMVEKKAVLDAKLACSVGGAGGLTGSNYTTAPTTDCPPLEDPLADRAPPTFSNICNETDLLVSGGTRTLSPGVYCGGLAIRSDAVVTLEPGVYIIKDGELLVDSNGQMKGENVGFYLTGDDSTFRFWSNGGVELTAPKEGPLAGILFFEDRSAPLLRTHQIKSDEARLLLGTIYLPNGILRVDSSQKVADESAYTAIVARRLELDIHPVLVLNTDYDLTDVPIPGALSGSGGRIVLAE